MGAGSAASGRAASGDQGWKSCGRIRIAVSTAPINAPTAPTHKIRSRPPKVTLPR